MDADSSEPGRTFFYGESFRQQLMRMSRVIWIPIILFSIFTVLDIIFLLSLQDMVSSVVTLLIFLPLTALSYFLCKIYQRSLRAYGSSLIITDENIIYRRKDGRETTARWQDIAFIRQKTLSFECELIGESGNVLLTFVRYCEDAPALYAMMQEKLLKCDAPCTRDRVFHRKPLAVLYCYTALVAVFGILFIDPNSRANAKLLSGMWFTGVLSLLALLFSTRIVLVNDDKIILIALCLRRAILFDNIIGYPFFPSLPGSGALALQFQFTSGKPAGTNQSWARSKKGQS